MRVQLTSLAVMAGVTAACSNDQFVNATKDAGSRTDGNAGNVVGSGGRGPGGSGSEKDADITPVASGGRPVNGAKDATSNVDVLDGAADGSSCDGAGCGDAAIPCTKTEECPEDRYCGSAGLCVRCTDFGLTDPTKILFGEPEPLSAVNSGATIEALRNPRAFDGGAKLLYVHDFAGNATVWLTGDFRVDPGSPLSPPIDGPGSESAALKVASGTGMFGGYNFFFDRSIPDDAGVNGPSAIYGAHVDSVGRTTAITALPAPFNDFPRVGFGFALSRNRAFWTERLDNALNVQLWTAPVEGDIIGTRVVPTMPNGCPVYELDYSVWAAWDGKFILIGYNERDDKCVQSAYSNDVGLVRVNASGQAIGNVVSLNVNLPAISDNDPSLSSNMCFLYFVSTRHESKLYRIYRARRLH